MAVSMGQEREPGAKEEAESGLGETRGVAEVRVTLPLAARRVAGGAVHAAKPVAGPAAGDGVVTTLAETRVSGAHAEAPGSGVVVTTLAETRVSGPVTAEPRPLVETRASGVVLARSVTRTRVSGAVSATKGGGPDEARMRSEVVFTGEARMRSEVVFTGEPRTHGEAALTDETRAGSASGFVDAPPEHDPVVPAGGRIGRFVVLRELGRGAMGVVLAAYDEELDRKVAIKLLHAGRGEMASIGRAMLLREAQAMAKLSHPNVVVVHEVGVIAETVFVAMEHVAGIDLQKWLAAETRPWREKVAVLLQAGAGLAAAHASGLVHRDFKTSNVLVGEDGRVRVADFGLAARRSGEASPGTRRTSGGLTETLTGEGALIGTPLYMAPELLRGRAATAASDQYAFCVALWEALYGGRPFDADSLADLTVVVEQRPLPATPPRADVPVWLYAAVCRGLAKAPEERWPSLAALMEALARDPEAERRLRRRRAVQTIAAITATVVIVGLVIFAYGAVRGYVAERRAEGRLAGLRAQMEALRRDGEADEAKRLLQTFVGLAENRGSVVLARAYLEWAALQEDHAAAIEAYGSAYIAARTPEDGQAALRGLIDRLSARGQVKEAAAALAALTEQAPQVARAPELQAVRLASTLARRDLQAARGVLAAGDPDGWSPVLEDMSRVTEVARARLGGVAANFGVLRVLDFDGDGTKELVVWDAAETVRVLRADVGFEVLREISIGAAEHVGVAEPVVAGEPLLVASYPASAANKFEVRVLAVQDDETVRTIDAWTDSASFTPVTVDFDGDGRRELYISTSAYARRFWRMERGADGAWTRRSAHAPTDAAGSDLTVQAVDFEGDGRRELVVAAGPWRAYDLRVYRPDAAGDADQVARKAFGSFAEWLPRLRAGGREVVAFIKTDAMIGPGRFPPDRPLGEPAGVYVVGFAGGAIEVQAHAPAQPSRGAARRYVHPQAADLDGDGVDELIVEDGADTFLMRPRAGRPLEPLMLAGMQPLVAGDLDGDGDDEVVLDPGRGSDRLLVLGTGTARLEPLQVDVAEPRAVPPGISDPVIADAWTHAEQLAAIGLARRSADELAAIAGLAGHVAPDMLLRTAELYAATGADELAAQQFMAAATRPDIAAAALAGAAQARRRLGDFAEAEALTRRQLAATPEAERAPVAAELARLTETAAARPELVLTFTRALDERWRIEDPVAVRRGLGRGELSVWASPTPVVAEFPLVWDGGPAALEVELETDTIEWGTEIGVEVSGLAGAPWLRMRVLGFGVSEAPVVRLTLADQDDQGIEPVTARTVRGRFAVFPAYDMAIREVTQGEAKSRRVLAMGRPNPPVRPPPGPLRLRLTAKALQAGFVAHVGIRAIRLTGFTAGEPTGTSDEAARLLVEGDFAGAAAALRGAPPDSERAVWRIEALLGLGQVEAATRAIKDVMAAGPADGPAQRGLHQRLRREDPVARLAAREALGLEMVEVLLQPGSSPRVRADDVEAVLTGLTAPPKELPDDPATLRLVTLTDLARGLAHEQAGQLTAARAAYDAAAARFAGRAFTDAEALKKTVQRRQLALAVAVGDAAAATAMVRAQVGASATPYLMLEQFQSDAALAELVGPEVFKTLLAETRAARE